MNNFDLIAPSIMFRGKLQDGLVECCRLGCAKKVPANKSKIVHYCDAEKHEYRSACSFACALIALPSGYMAQA
jgi:hypothetical protein